MRGATVATLLALLAGCASVPAPPADADSIPGQRHTSAALLGYQTKDFRWRPTVAEAEQAMHARELAQLDARLALAPGEALDAALPELLGAVMMFNTRIDAARAPALAAIPTLAQRAPDYQRSVLAAAYRLYALDAAPVLWPMLPQLTTPREFAVAAYALIKAGADSTQVRQRLAAMLAQQFPDWRDEPRLRALGYAVGLLPMQATPPLADLLASPLQPGYPVVFSVQRRGRPAHGLALVRGADGHFLREPDGSVFAVPQLARALANLPGTITLGNTPQGIFTVRGASTAENPWIGPTPFLESKLPVEASYDEFVHVIGDRLLPPGDKAANLASWSEARYDALLAPGWRSFEPIKEAWLAGRAGRDEILMHGTVVNPQYYAGDSYFPGTPSAGCLVTNEQWDPASGRLLQSDQLRLAQAFVRASSRSDAVTQGFLVVVELPDGAGPVRLDDVLDAVQGAEQMRPTLAVR